MALCRAVKYYLKEDGATNDENDDFLDFCSMFSKGQTTVRPVPPLCKTTLSFPNFIQEK